MVEVMAAGTAAEKALCLVAEKGVPSVDKMAENSVADLALYSVVPWAVMKAATMAWLTVALTVDS